MELNGKFISLNKTSISMSIENLFWDICFICNNSCQTCKTKVILSDGKVRFILKGFGKSGIFNPTDLTALKEPNARESCPLLPPPWGWFGSRYKHRVSIYELRFSPLSPSSQPSSSLQEAEKERITQEGTVFSTFNRMEVETIYIWLRAQSLCSPCSEARCF